MVNDHQKIKSKFSIWWIRKDLRLNYNLTLEKALQNSEQIIPIFICENKLSTNININSKSYAFLYYGLKELEKSIEGYSGKLIITNSDIHSITKYIQTKFEINSLYVQNDIEDNFINDIKKIDKYLPKKRQNLMFTATFSDPFRSLVKQFSNDPIEISVAKDNETGKNIEHYCHPVDASNKAKLLIHLIKNEKWNQALVFTRTKHGANRLTKKLINAKITAVAIHSNKTQNYRTKALNKFKKNHIQILVATDVAARGIDIKNMNQVVNFDLPSVAKDYIHRIGRTGRAGKSGKAISFVCSDQQKLLRDIQKLLNQKLPMYTVEGFEPTNDMQPIKKSKKKKKFRKRFKK